jgi:Concanavalin A-like lectin/glucanases superfamily
VRVLAFAAVSCLAACGLAASGLGSFGDSTSDAGVSGDLDGSLAPPPAIDGAARVIDADEGHPGPLPDVAAPTSMGDAATPDAATPGSTVDASPADDAGEDAAPGADAGDALSFANGAYVDVGAMPIPRDFTLEAWVKPATGDGGTAEAEVVAEDRNGQSVGQLRLGITAGALFFMMSDAAAASFGLFTGTGYALQSSQTLAPGAWSHVAVTKSGASFALYIQAAQARPSRRRARSLTAAPPPRSGSRAGSPRTVRASTARSPGRSTRSAFGTLPARGRRSRRR